MAEVKVRRFGLKSWVAAYEGATICFHGKGRTKDDSLGLVVGHLEQPSGDRTRVACDLAG